PHRPSPVALAGRQEASPFAQGRSGRRARRGSVEQRSSWPLPAFSHALLSPHLMKHSAGTLLYREAPHGLEVLIVHPAGNYNRHAPWSIPKGVPTSQETDLEVTARRETFEETGVTPTSLVSLGHSDYKKSRK